MKHLGMADSPVSRHRGPFEPLSLCTLRRWTIAVFCLAISMIASKSHGARIDYEGLEVLFGEAVTASATGKPQRTSDTPLSMDIITSDDIQRSGALDIPQLLRGVAGVGVTRNFKGNADVGIRGINQPLSNRLLVLVNGRQVYMDNFGMTVWESIPVSLDEIKQIEIVRGPNSSLYGFNAASGVINIITYNPLLNDVDRVSLRTGSQNEHAASIVHTTKINDQFGIRLAASGRRSDGYDRSTMTPAPKEDHAVDHRSIALDSILKLSDTSDLRLEMGFNDQASDSLAPFHTPIDLDTRTRHYKLAYQLEQNGLWSAQIYRNEADLVDKTGRFYVTAEKTLSKNRLNVLQLSTLQSKGNAHTYRLGFEYRDNTLSGENISPESGEFSMGVFTLNGMWDWQWSEQLSFTQSYSFNQWSTERDGSYSIIDSVTVFNEDDFERDETEYSFNLALLYKKNSGLHYRLSIARGLHIPSLIELSRGRLQSESFSEIYGNPLLETESNQTIEMGVRYWCEDTHIQLKANIFQQTLDNVINNVAHGLSAFGGSGGLLSDFTFDNVGKTKVIGTELEISSPPKSPLSWSFNYSYVDHNDQDDGDLASFVDFESSIPQHRLNASISYKASRWYSGMNVHYVSGVNDYTVFVGDPIQTRRETDIDDYIVLNARLAYDISPSTTVSLEGFNLFDKQTQRLADSTQGLSPIGANQIGRTITFSIKHDFNYKEQ